MFRVVYLLMGCYGIAWVMFGATVALSVLTVHVVVVPLIFRYSRWFQRKLIFLNSVSWPLHTDFSDPSKCGIEGARNLYTEYQSKIDVGTVKIGIWHILPASVLQRLSSSPEQPIDEEARNATFDAELATSGRPIVLYCHGNANNRAASHRIQLYRVLQAMDLHVVAFDYRGYGDSSDIQPTEPGVVEDALVVYDWLLSTIANSEHPPPVYVWGHSLGTGISSHMLGNLEELSLSLLERNTSLQLPHGLILEAPFNNIQDEVSNHPLTVLVRWLPYFDAAFVRPFSGRREYEFRSDRHLARARRLPALLLHAKDDLVVPYHLGVKLYEAVAASRSGDDAPVELHSYERRDGLGHKWICDAPDLPLVVGNFIDQTSAKM